MVDLSIAMLVHQRVITASLHFVIDAGRMLGPTTETQRWPLGSWLGLGPLVLNRWVSRPMDPMGRKEKHKAWASLSFFPMFPGICFWFLDVFGIKAFKSSPWAILIRACSNWRCSHPHHTIALNGYPLHPDIFSHSSIQCLISSWISHYHIVFNY